jgi:hypothetical protein
MRVHHAEHLLTRQPERDELVVFLGDWRAEGTSYGGTDQSGSDPCANGVPWTSTRTGRWHTGRFFLILDERACPGGAEFDTLSMGADASTGGYFVRSFENHGFYRHYDVSLDGVRWSLTGEHEWATVVFSDDDRMQTISWEWKPDDTWLLLCDGVATRTD